jgi:molybdopterin molybdotransferase
MGCDNNQKLISAGECLDFLLSNANFNQKTEIVNLTDALDKVLDRILANDEISKINVPNFDNSAMDGYAINLPDGLKPPYSFDLVGRIAAGEVGDKILPNQAVKIFTGAKLPTGANCVAILERSEEIEGENGKQVVEVFGVLEIGENIRPKGDDIKIDEVILEKGKKLNAADIGLLASVGIDKVEVFQKLKVGVFFSGDEIINPGEKLTDGKIYNSNRWTINALLQKLNFEIIDFGNIADDFDLTVKTLDDLSKKCEVIITTGGVSIGEEDHIKPAVEKLGSIDMWSIKMKPGKPLAYGKIGKSIGESIVKNNKHTHFAGLPGNPVSAMATFHLFIMPFLRKLSGEKNYQNITQKVQINTNLSSRFRREFIRVRLDNSTTPPTAIPYKNQSSGVLSSMSWASGFLEIPDETNLKSGDVLNYYPFIG